MLYKFILVVQGLVAAALIGIILMQKSEGGGLGVGGSPAGFLSARSAGDFLTRATAFLAVAFVGLCIALAVLASIEGRGAGIDVEAVRAAERAATAAPEADGAPGAGGVPLPGAGVPAPSVNPLEAAAGAAPAGVPAPGAPVGPVAAPAEAPKGAAPAQR